MKKEKGPAHPDNKERRRDCTPPRRTTTVTDLAARASSSVTLPRAAAATVFAKDMMVDGARVVIGELTDQCDVYEQCSGVEIEIAFPWVTMLGCINYLHYSNRFLHEAVP